MMMSPRSFSGYRSLWWLSLLSLYVKRSNVKAVQIEAVKWEAVHLKRSKKS